MIISLIAAMDHNRVIGYNNAIPWKMPRDMRHFREKTLNKCVVMGHNTYKSLNMVALPNRQNVVLTRDVKYVNDDVNVAHNAVDAITICNHDELVVIGGAEIYKMFMPHVDIMYITYIDGDFVGDSWFPECDGEWDVKSWEVHTADDENPHSCDFAEFKRIKLNKY